MEAIQKFKAKWDADVVYLRMKAIYETAFQDALFGQYFTYYVDSYLNYVCEKYGWGTFQRGRFYLYCRRTLVRLETESEVDKEVIKEDWIDWGFPEEEFENFWKWIKMLLEVLRGIRELSVTKNFSLCGEVEKAPMIEIELIT
jgi:hypothetical protein